MDIRDFAILAGEIDSEVFCYEVVDGYGNPITDMYVDHAKRQVVVEHIPESDESKTEAKKC